MAGQISSIARAIALGAAAASLLAVPAHAASGTRAVGLVPLAQQAAVSGCMATRGTTEAASQAATEMAAQGIQPGGCILPLRPAPPPAATTPPAPPATPPAPPAPPAAPVGGGLGWLVPALGGLAALVAGIALLGGSDDTPDVPGISPG